MARKFGEGDRNLVRLALEQRLAIKLRRPGRRRKVMADEAGRFYWVMGYGDWHGIEPDMIDALDPDHDALLVIARRAEHTITVFGGPLRPLLLKLDQLTVNQNGQYQFDLEELRGKLVVRQIPEVRLDFLTGFRLAA